MKSIKVGKFIVFTSNENADKMEEMTLKKFIDRLEEESKEIPTMVLTNPRIIDYTPIVNFQENSHVFIPKRRKLKEYQKR